METETVKPLAVRFPDRRVWIELGYVFYARHLSEMQLEMDHYPMSFM